MIDYLCHFIIYKSTLIQSSILCEFIYSLILCCSKMPFLIFHLGWLLLFSLHPGRPAASAAAPAKGGMQLGKTKRTNQFLESLKAEGEVILEDVQPSAGPSRAAAPPPTDPITLTVEEKISVTLKRDGGLSNFDVQGTLLLQILNQEDAHIQVQVLLISFFFIYFT